MTSINEIIGATQLSLLWICAIAGSLVFVALMYSTATFRKGDRSASLPKRSTAKEVAWNVVPIAIVVAAALPAMRAAAPASDGAWTSGWTMGARITENREASCTPVAKSTSGLASAAMGSPALSDCPQHR